MYEIGMYHKDTKMQCHSKCLICHLRFKAIQLGRLNKSLSVCLRVSSLKPNNKNNNIVSFERIWEEPNEEPTLGPTSRHDLGQCDQMASLFFNICSFKGMEINPMA